jgi:hypothetical protein
MQKIPNAGGRDRMAALAKLVGDADLPIGRFSSENPIRTVSISGAMRQRRELERRAWPDRARAVDLANGDGLMISTIAVIARARWAQPWVAA